MISITKNTPTNSLSLPNDTNFGGKGPTGVISRIVARFSFSGKELKDLKNNRSDVSTTAEKIVAKANELLIKDYQSIQTEFYKEKTTGMDASKKEEHLNQLMARDEHYKDKLHTAIIKVTQATYPIWKGIDKETETALIIALNNKISSNEGISTVLTRKSEIETKKRNEEENKLNTEAKNLIRTELNLQENQTISNEDLQKLTNTTIPKYKKTLLDLKKELSNQEEVANQAEETSKSMNIAKIPGCNPSLETDASRARELAEKSLKKVQEQQIKIEKLETAVERIQKKIGLSQSPSLNEGL